MVVIPVSSIFFLLFLFTAITKISDYHTFSYQLSMAPLIKPYASTVCWLLPLLELLTAILLVHPFTRVTGLILSSMLTIVFSGFLSYLYVNNEPTVFLGNVLLYGMPWKEQLLVNLVLMAVAVTGTVAKLGTIERNNI